MTDSGMKRYAFFEGQIVPFEDAKVSVMTHAFNYGTGVFEGIRGYWNEAREEIYIFRLPEHYQRFLRNTRMMCIDVTQSVEELMHITLELVRMHQFQQDVYIRPLAYKSTQQIGVSMEGVDNALTIFAVPYGNYVDIDRGLRLAVSTWRRTSDNAIPSRAKVTGNYANTALIKNEAVLNGFDEAIALNDQGQVAEGSAENVFLVRNGVLITPPLSADILEGITRDTVIELAQNEFGIRTEQRPIARTELYYADEMFLTGTGAQVAPVTSIDRRPVGTGEIGPITHRLQKLYFDVVKGHHHKYLDWLTPVNQRTAAARSA